MQSTADPPRRRRFRFSLRTFFVVVAVLSAAFAHVVWNWQIVRERQAVRASLEAAGGTFWTWDQPQINVLEISEGGGDDVSPIRRWLGDKKIAAVWLRYDRRYEFHVAELRRHFPEVVYVGRSHISWIGSGGREDETPLEAFYNSLGDRLGIELPAWNNWNMPPDWPQDGVFLDWGPDYPEPQK